MYLALGLISQGRQLRYFTFLHFELKDCIITLLICCFGDTTCVLTFFLTFSVLANEKDCFTAELPAYPQEEQQQQQVGQDMLPSFSFFCLCLSLMRQFFRSKSWDVRSVNKNEKEIRVVSSFLPSPWSVGKVWTWTADSIHETSMATNTRDLE